MLVWNKHFRLFFLACLVFPSCQARKQVIGCQSGAGLFYNYLGVVNNLLWCEAHGATPVVQWDSHNLYYQKELGENVWEYYFEPVSKEQYLPGDLIWEFNMAPDSSEIRPVTQDACTQYESSELRKRAHAIIERYIKVKPSIAQKIDHFYHKYIASKVTIGIHVRGTDKKNEVKPCNRRDMFARANKLKKLYPDCQFFVATDEERFLEEAKKQLQGPVISYNAYRSHDGTAVHWQNKAHKAHLGEEVLIEAYLLARCSIFFHGCSSVSTAVLFINSELPHLSFCGGN